jgi:hypothetical protein
VQLDLDGKCCGPDGQMTPSGYCCQSGNVDDAGVCDGTGDSVPKEVSLDSVFLIAISKRRLLDTEQLKQALETIVRDKLGYPEGYFEVVVTGDNSNNTKVCLCRNAIALYPTC